MKILSLAFVGAISAKPWGFWEPTESSEIEESQIDDDIAELYSTATENEHYTTDYIPTETFPLELENGSADYLFTTEVTAIQSESEFIINEENDILEANSYENAAGYSGSGMVQENEIQEFREFKKFKNSKKKWANLANT